MFDEFMMMLQACGDDVEYDFDYIEDSDYRIDFCDFGGFDDHWGEIEREYTHPEAVEAFGEWLESRSTSHEGDFYVTYYFDGFSVTIGYTSMDI